ncbi:MAG: pilin [Methylococcaceae bacterium]
MKNYAYILWGVLLLNSNLAVADNHAVTISLRDSDDKDVAAIHQVVAQAVSNGVVDTMLTYKPSEMASNKFFACVEATTGTTPEQFTNFVNDLHRVSINASSHYQLKTQPSCGKNEALACIADPLACFNSAFITTTGKYMTYVAKAQFAASLEELSVGKYMIDMKLNEGSMYMPSTYDIGMQSSSKNCSAIFVDNYDAGAGTAAISCIIQGNSAVIGKNIVWTRTNDGKWQCTTDADSKYSAGCKN